MDNELTRAVEDAFEAYLLARKALLAEPGKDWFDRRDWLYDYEAQLKDLSEQRSDEYRSLKPR